MDSEEYWNEWLRIAELKDGRAQVRSLRTPPILADLIKAARKTTLRRFFPFVSHDILRFSTRPMSDSGDPLIVPVFVVLSHDDGYMIYEGDFSQSDVPMVISTHSAAVATSEIERLLTRWPHSSSGHH